MPKKTQLQDPLYTGGVIRLEIDLPAMPLPPFAYRLAVFWVMTIGVEPQAMTEASFADEVIFGHGFDELDELGVYLVLLP